MLEKRYRGNFFLFFNNKPIGIVRGRRMMQHLAEVAAEKKNMWVTHFYTYFLQYLRAI